MHYDLTNASIDDLERFVFDHAVAERAEDDSRKEWYWTEEFDATIDPDRQLELTAALFEHAGNLRWKYSEEQLEQGLWFVFGPGGEEWFAGLLRDESLALPLRQRFITTIFDLYEQLLSQIELDTATFMVWDLLIDKFFNGDANDCVVPVNLETTMFDTLSRILALPDQECQRAALHGLGHLHHRDTAAAVESYLARNRSLPDEIVEYARRVRDGKGVL